jgi:PhoH-like ATPase
VRMIQNKVMVDTNVLLEYPQFLDLCEDVVVCDIVVEELDNIIHSNKNEETRYQARMARNALIDCKTKTFHIISDASGLPKGWDEKKNDNLIVLLAKQLGVPLYSNDLIMQIKAESLGVEVHSFHGEESKAHYKGFQEIVLSSCEFRDLIKNRAENTYNLLINEYLIVRDSEDMEVLGLFKWTDCGLYNVPVTKFNSALFGTTEPRDAYQAIAIDSLLTTSLTILTGVAGTAKTLLALSYAFEKLKSTKCSRLVVVHDSMPLKDSVDLGAIPGTRDEKILGGSSLGEIFSSKLGDFHEIDRYIENGQIHFIPTSSIRGFETKADEILFVTEGQNMNIATCKLLLQRVGEGCKVIIEGDNRTQIDARNASFGRNGMSRAIEVFKGSDLFSCVELQEIYRSRICELADKM